MQEKAPTDQSSEGQWGLLCTAYEEGTRFFLIRKWTCETLQGGNLPDCCKICYLAISYLEAN